MLQAIELARIDAVHATIERRQSTPTTDAELVRSPVSASCTRAAPERKPLFRFCLASSPLAFLINPHQHGPTFLPRFLIYLALKYTPTRSVAKPKPERLMSTRLPLRVNVTDLSSLVRK